ncbi:hypothetical protein V8E51_017637 [Hyaloscypha variabilis]
MSGDRDHLSSGEQDFLGRLNPNGDFWEIALQKSKNRKPDPPGPCETVSQALLQDELSTRSVSFARHKQAPDSPREGSPTEPNTPEDVQPPRSPIQRQRFVQPAGSWLHRTFSGGLGFQLEAMTPHETGSGGRRPRPATHSLMDEPSSQSASPNPFADSPPRGRTPHETGSGGRHPYPAIQDSPDEALHRSVSPAPSNTSSRPDPKRRRVTSPSPSVSLTPKIRSSLVHKRYRVGSPSRSASPASSSTSSHPAKKAKLDTNLRREALATKKRINAAQLSGEQPSAARSSKTSGASETEYQFQLVLPHTVIVGIEQVQKYISNQPAADRPALIDKANSFGDKVLVKNSERIANWYEFQKKEMTHQGLWDEETYKVQYGALYNTANFTIRGTLQCGTLYDTAQMMIDKRDKKAHGLKKIQAKWTSARDKLFIDVYLLDDTYDLVSDRNITALATMAMTLDSIRVTQLINESLLQRARVLADPDVYKKGFRKVTYVQGQDITYAAKKSSQKKFDEEMIELLDEDEIKELNFVWGPLGMIEMRGSGPKPSSKSSKLLTYEDDVEGPEDFKLLFCKVQRVREFVEDGANQNETPAKELSGEEVVRSTQEVDNANDNTADHGAALKKARAVDLTAEEEDPEGNPVVD